MLISTMDNSTGLEEWSALLLPNCNGQTRYAKPPALGHVFVCAVCGTAFSRVLYLQRHVLGHTAEKNYDKCPLCGKVHADQHNRQVHLQTHTGQRRFKCRRCPKVFKHHHQLVAHTQSGGCRSQFQCQHCDKSFSMRLTLKAHLRMHTKQFPYVCPCCKARFAHLGALRLHLAKHSASNVHECVHCGYLCPSQTELDSHLNTKHQDILPKLPSDDDDSDRGTLGYSNINLADIDNSNSTSTNNKSKPSKGKHQCTYCNKSYSSYNGLHTHLKVHTGETPHVCNHCGRGFRSKDSLIQHVRTHTGERPYRCMICGQSFTSRATCNTHMKLHQRPDGVSHTDELKNAGALQLSSWQVGTGTGLNQVRKAGYTLQCRHCPRAFKYTAKLERHMQSVHNDTISPYSCQVPWCDKSYKRQEHLNQHIRRHHPEKLSAAELKAAEQLDAQAESDENGQRRFVCTICDKVFLQRRYLKSHMEYHTNNFSYQCEICNKGFPKPSLLTKHMRSHSGESLHTCETCGKTYKQAYSLKVHQQAAHGAGGITAQRTCEVCGKVFNNPGAVRTHMVVHTKERNFECGICHKKYSQSSSLRAHVKTHNTENVQDASLAAQARQPIKVAKPKRKPQQTVETPNNDIPSGPTELPNNPVQYAVTQPGAHFTSGSMGFSGPSHCMYVPPYQPAVAHNSNVVVPTGGGNNIMLPPGSEVGYVYMPPNLLTPHT